LLRSGLDVLGGKVLWKKGILSIAFWAALVQGACSVEIVDQAGRRVSTESAPRRIVALAPSIAECLFALGLDEEIVGVTDYTNFPPQALSKPRVGSYIHLQIEAIVALKPDLVVATMDGNPKAQVERMEQLGLKVVVTNPRTLDDLYETLLILGKILRRESIAEQLVENMRGTIRTMSSLVASRPKPRVLLQVGSNPMVVAGDDTLQDHLIKVAGGENVPASQGRGYIPLSLERVITLAPEVILISSMADSLTAERVKESWKRWPQIPAVALGRIHVIDGDLIDRPSPRIVEGLKRMTEMIHPEVSSSIEESLGSTGDRS
jgi:iron complex transport system substrate-binding protein